MSSPTICVLTDHILHLLLKNDAWIFFGLFLTYPLSRNNIVSTWLLNMSWVVSVLRFWTRLHVCLHLNINYSLWMLLVFFLVLVIVWQAIEFSWGILLKCFLISHCFNSAEYNYVLFRHTVQWRLPLETYFQTVTFKYIWFFVLCKLEAGTYYFVCHSLVQWKYQSVAT